MEKKITYVQFQSARAIVKACDPIVRKKATLQKKIDAIMAEIQECDENIKALDAGYLQIVGVSSFDVVKKVMEPGSPAKYVAADGVTFDEESRQYVIRSTEDTPVAPEEQEESVEAMTEEGPEEEMAEMENPEVEEDDFFEMPTTADGPGSDFDIDKERFFED